MEKEIERKILKNLVINTLEILRTKWSIIRVSTKILLLPSDGCYNTFGMSISWLSLQDNL